MVDPLGGSAGNPPGNPPGRAAGRRTAPVVAVPPPVDAYGVGAGDAPVAAVPPPADAYGAPAAAAAPAIPAKRVDPPPPAPTTTPTGKKTLPRLQCKKCGIVYSGALPWDRKCLDCQTPLVEADPPPPRSDAASLRPVDPGSNTTTSSKPPTTSTPLLWAPGTSRKPELIVTRYLIKDPQADMLGIGAKGVVYRAHDRRMGDRPVAIKLFFESGEPTDAEGFRERRRVEREIRIQAALTHPAIVTAHDRFDTPHGSGIVLEFIDGESLEDRVRKSGPLPVREAARLAIEVARAVEFMHSRGIIHRDLKPSNVLLTRDGNVKLIDFGVAKYKKMPLGLGKNAKDPEATTSDPSPDPDSDNFLTHDGTIVGTPCYMSPEQAHGRVAFVDERSDIYGIGAIVYYAISARPPFSGDDVETILDRVRKVPPPRPSKWNTRVDAPLDAIVAHSMKKIPEQRFATAAAFAEELRRYLDGEPLDPAVFREPYAKRFARAFAAHRTMAAVMVTSILAAGMIWAAFIVADRFHKEEAIKARLDAAGKALQDLDPKAAQAFYDEVLHDDPGNEAAKNGYLSAMRATIHVNAYQEGKHYLDEARKARLATSSDQAEKLFDLAKFRLEDAKRSGSPVQDLDKLIDEARGISHITVEKPKAFSGDCALRLVRLTSDLSEPLNRELSPIIPLPAKQLAAECGFYQGYIRPVKASAGLEPLLFPVRIVRGEDCVVNAIPAAWPGMVYIRGQQGFRPGHPRHDDLPPQDVEPFCIDRREVTVAEYKQYLDSIQDPAERARALPAHWPRSGGSTPDPEDFPIANISFEAAKGYAKFRGKELPSEAQWQLAASGGSDDRDYPWGTRFVATCTNCGTGAPVRAGSNERDRSPFGVLDMGGNVSEYVDGWFDPKGRVRLAKGGNFLKKAPVWERLPVEGPDRTVGFRCVRAIK